MEAATGRTDPYARRAVLGLIAIATLVRLRFTFATELGNDEVYYWAYASFPDWSHFDHPPMIGWVIQLFTLNLALDSEVFIRLAAVVSAAIATWLMYLIGRRLGGERAGLFAAILHTSAVYGSVLAGVVILPDAPLVVFWLLALWLLLEALPAETIGTRERRLVLFAGAAIGLAILSKYQGVFIGAGALLYVLLYDRRWLRQPAFYASMALAALIASPILIWNLKNDFISFTYCESGTVSAVRLSGHRARRPGPVSESADVASHRDGGSGRRARISGRGPGRPPHPAAQWATPVDSLHRLLTVSVNPSALDWARVPASDPAGRCLLGGAFRGL